MSQEFIKIENLKRFYDRSKALNGINISFSKGKEYVIKGASGSGKSTLLYLLGGLDRPTEGTILIENEDLNQMNDERLALYRNRNVGFVFQFHFLLTSMNALDNIYLPARLSGEFNQKITKRVSELADILNVKDLLKKMPYELSGGEQQRINIIRALSLNPPLLLCDEPTGNLDSQNSSVVIELLRTLSKENGSTLILVTHDKDIAGSFSNQLQMRDGQFV